MQEIRQSVWDVIDTWGQRDGVDIIGYFKKKWLKSSVIADDIDYLKSIEESEKNKEYIRKLVFSDENSKSEVIKDEHAALEKYASVISSKKNKNWAMSIQKDILNGDIIEIEVKDHMTILIRLDNIKKIPKIVLFWKYDERDYRGK